jgi:hypothetical protein
MTLPPYPGQDPPPDEDPAVRPPYGQPPQGQQPYGAWQGGNDTTPGWNGLSIAAFVLGLTCLLGIPAIVLGIIGLRQVRRDRSRGGWMAVTGIVLGALGTLALAGLVASGVWLANQVVTPGNAEAGMCVTTEEWENHVSLLEEDCAADHDGQIFVVYSLSESRAGADPVAQCTERLGADAARAMNDGLTVFAITEDDASDPGDTVVCLLEKADGEKLSEELDY